MKYSVPVVFAGCAIAIFVMRPFSSTSVESGHTADSLDVVKASVAENRAVLIDVREQNEWDAGHLKMATLVPMSLVKANELTAEMRQSLPDDKPIYLHCRSGGRVLTVSELLRAQGYDARPLKAGYADLLEAGFEKAHGGD